MANHNDYDDILRAARDKQKAGDQAAQQQQQAQQAADARVKAEALAARQKTLGLAAYVANLLSQHHVMPTVRLVERVPGVATKSFFGKVTYSPDTYRVITEGWAVMQGRRFVGSLEYGGYVLQGLLLTPGKELVQYTGGQTNSFGPPEPQGDLITTRYEPLGQDPKDDNVVAWGYKGTKGGGASFSENVSNLESHSFTYERHQKTEVYHSANGSDIDIPNIETAIQQHLGQLAAKLVPDNAP